MQDYEFEVTIVAVVRIRAENEDQAREVVASSALASPSADEIGMANTGQFLLGKQATIIAVEAHACSRGFRDPAVATSSNMVWFDSNSNATRA